jgi:hypothetical protein
VRPEKRPDVHCRRCGGKGHYESTCNEAIWLVLCVELEKI